MVLPFEEEYRKNITNYWMKFLNRIFGQMGK